jgi:hypothetical protein
MGRTNEARSVFAAAYQGVQDRFMMGLLVISTFSTWNLFTPTYAQRRGARARAEHEHEHEHGTSRLKPGKPSCHGTKHTGRRDTANNVTLVPTGTSGLR